MIKIVAPARFIATRFSITIRFSSIQPIFAAAFTIAYENILSPEVYIKNRRAEIRELEENLIYLQGQADLLEDGAKKAQASLSQTQAALAEKNALLQELRKLLPSEDDKARLRAELQALENP